MVINLQIKLIILQTKRKEWFLFLYNREVSEHSSNESHASDAPCKWWMDRSETIQFPLHISAFSWVRWMDARGKQIHQTNTISSPAWYISSYV